MGVFTHSRHHFVFQSLSGASFLSIRPSIGIDPGVTGGICLIFEQSNPVNLYRFAKADPLIVLTEAFAEVRTIYNPIIILEKVWPRPGQGICSSWAFAEGYGRIQGWLVANGFRFDLVSPQRWQGILPPADDPKARARAFCDSQWGLDAFIFPNCRVPDQGAMDAACMAEYGRRVSLGQIAAAPVKAKKKPRRAIRLAG